MDYTITLNLFDLLMVVLVIAVLIPFIATMVEVKHRVRLRSLDRYAKQARDLATDYADCAAFDQITKDDRSQREVQDARRRLLEHLDSYPRY